jgi:hypothetical protein
MTRVNLQILRNTDASQPGWVECRLTDAWRRAWTFVDKVPIFTSASLDAHSSYPQPGTIRCRVIRLWRDAANREIVTIDTTHPDAVESADGATRFDVLPGQLAESSH